MSADARGGRRTTTASSRTRRRRAPKRAFKFTQLRTNAVLRWEYRPGSTLFVVWPHGRQDPDPTRDRFDQSWTSDYRDLFDVHPDNTFLVKLAYWLGR